MCDINNKIKKYFFSDFIFRRGILVPIRDAGTDFLKDGPTLK